jgi:transposase InsO family protein
MGPLPQTLTGKHYIIVAVDHFTKWPEARAVAEADASTIVQFLFEDVIYCHGVSVLMTTDRGTEFVNELVTILASVYKIRHIRTTAYHPQGNGQVERMNRVIKDILAKITPKKTGDWSLSLPTALSAIRNTRQQSTRFTPSELLYGCQMRQHFESDADPESHDDPIEYAQAEFGRILAIRSQAHGFIKKAQDRQKKYHDGHMQILPPLEIGDLVMLWHDMVEVNLSAKLEPKWEGPFVIKDYKRTTYHLKNLDNTLLL